MEAFSRKNCPESWWLDNLGRNPFHIATLAGNNRFLRTILGNVVLQDAIHILLAKGLDGMTPVHLAVEGGHVSCVRLLTSVFCIRNLEVQPDAWKRSPVHLSIAKGLHECYHTLINARILISNPSMPDASGKSFFSYLDEKNTEQKEIGSELLVNHYDKFENKDHEGQSIWHHAIRFLDVNSFLWLNEVQPSTIDCSNDAHETPLHLAVRYKRHDWVKRLLECGANLKTNEQKDTSPLMLACSLGQKEVVRSMMATDRQAATDVDKDGRTALHYALQSQGSTDEDQEEIVKLLVAAMTSVDIEDSQGRTPLHLASLSCRVSIVSILLESGANPSIKDNRGYNALHHVAQSSLTHSETPSEKAKKVMAENAKHVIGMILHKSPGCIDELDAGRNTAPYSALQMGNDEIALFLLSMGAHL